MPQQLDPDVKSAREAVRFAQDVRRYHRRRTERGSRRREWDLQNAIERLAEAMKPLRSRMGKFPYEPATERVFERQRQIREASDALQTERRKLWKMLDHDKRRKNRA